MDAPPALSVRPEDRRGARDEGALAIHVECHRECGADQDIGRLDVPVAAPVSGARYAAVRGQQEVMRIHRADGQRHGAAAKARGGEMPPGGPAVVGAEQPAPRAGIVRAQVARPQGADQHQRRDGDPTPGSRANGRPRVGRMRSDHRLHGGGAGETHPASPGPGGVAIQHGARRVWSLSCEQAPDPRFSSATV